MTDTDGNIHKKRFTILGLLPESQTMETEAFPVIAAEVEEI